MKSTEFVHLNNKVTLYLISLFLKKRKEKKSICLQMLSMCSIGNLHMPKEKVKVTCIA